MPDKRLEDIEARLAQVIADGHVIGLPRADLVWGLIQDMSYLLHRLEAEVKRRKAAEALLNRIHPDVLDPFQAELIAWQQLVKEAGDA